jgi:hypothetical protein
MKQTVKLGTNSYVQLDSYTQPGSTPFVAKLALAVLAIAGLAMAGVGAYNQIKTHESHVCPMHRSAYYGPGC